MVHVGEPPPLYDEILEVLDPGDVVTHCFNGKAGGSIIEDEDLFALAERCAGEGIRLDVGHGGASFSFKVAEVAIARGLMPFSISTDLHNRSLDSPVWDMGTTMSKLLAVGMPFEKVVEASTLAPMSVIGLPTRGPARAGRAGRIHRVRRVEADDLRIARFHGRRGRAARVDHAALDRHGRRSASRRAPTAPGRTACRDERLPDLRLGDGAMNEAPADTCCGSRICRPISSSARGSRNRSTA